MPPKKKPVSFEASLAELESLVTVMEGGDLSLEDALQTFENGIKLTRECQLRLQEAEQKVQLLLEKNGELQAQPLTSSDASADEH